MVRFLSPALSELVLQRELNDPRVVGDAGALAAGGDAAEAVRRVKTQSGSAEIDVIEEVEELGAELHVVRLMETEILRGREVHLIQTRQVDWLAGGVSKLA